jgi:predicted nucleic acid-binding Zn ribbon protein
MSQHHSSGSKPKLSREQRAVRRNQIIFIGLSLILILSMVISLFRF